MKLKITSAILISALALSACNKGVKSEAKDASGVTISSADMTVSINGKPVDQKVVDAAFAQIAKNPQVAAQLNNPQVKKEILQSIGMQQAILQDGDAKGLDKTPAYQDKLEQVKPMIYAQILQDEQASKPVTDDEVKAKYEQIKADALKSGGKAESMPEFDKVKDQIKQSLQGEQTQKFFESMKAKYQVEVK